MRIAYEQRVLSRMFRLYCRSFHRTSPGLCVDCTELLQYSLERLASCPYGDEKPSCRRCPIHCYAAVRRQAVQDVMRFAGLRMIRYHPVMALRHLLHEKSRKHNLRKITKQ